MRDHDRCDWAFSDNLYLFQPGYTPLNKRKRRTFKRQALRDAKRASYLQKLALPVAAPIAPVDASGRSSARTRGSVTKNPMSPKNENAILQAIDEEIDLLGNVRALLTGRPVPSKRGRALKAQSVAASRSASLNF